MRFLYVRVSAADGSQNIDRQVTEQDKYDRVFIDKASGSTKDRVQLQEMLSSIQEGDIVDIHSIDRLARNINDLLLIVKTITEDKRSEIYFIKENLRFTNNTDNPFNNLMLHIIGSIACFERNIIRMRQAEGIKIAREKGIYSKERKKKLSTSKVEELERDIKLKTRISDICIKYKISKPTYYKYKERYNL